MPKYGESVESIQSMSEDLNSTGGTVILKGWDIAPAKFYILNAIEELLDYPSGILIEFIKREEIAFSCSRYEMEEDCRDEGFSYWVNYHKKWKKGLGKCTKYEIKLVTERKDD